MLQDPPQPACSKAQLKRAMGALLESPALTRRERPLAEDFLQEQLTKLKSAGSDARAAKGIERLQGMMKLVQDARRARGDSATLVVVCVTTAGQDKAPSFGVPRAFRAHALARRIPLAQRDGRCSVGRAAAAAVAEVAVEAHAARHGPCHRLAPSGGCGGDGGECPFFGSLPPPMSLRRR